MEKLIITGNRMDLPNPRYVRFGHCKRCGLCCLNEDCEHLRINKGELATCLIFGSDERPSHCSIYPGGPPIRNPKCGYYFRDRWNNDKIVVDKV